MSVKILIVDDEISLLVAISDYLTGRGFECECASEMAEAVALLSHVPFDLVLTDVYLSPIPQADGFAVLAFVRERGLSTRVAVMTAHDTPQVLSEAERLAADLFLLKPVPLSWLAETLMALTAPGIPN